MSHPNDQSNRTTADARGSTTADGKVYYSTPFGDTKDGRQQLFLLQRDGVQYVPAFRSVESMKAFYERMNRAAFVIIEGGVQTVLETNRTIDFLKNAGVVIEPLSEQPVVIMPSS
ncbi:hypothetical protein H7J88_18895 [Mycolicibacterium flavescens]|uniref:SseB protein N-terminal domain-containing protein n=1 Tax=Mycolicibacterium flavescens TaxID=1776 RepID=A0A1E3RNB1_MYCFV|nr:hypothetical protein [Mycolicibacterium flavescens]MCV7281700.1 hypothetical protein [Mycolicibacterium flavescens]ODQ90897.1 hypothetical protein BHQ18_09320 [Mycolicibacterium flavescens]